MSYGLPWSEAFIRQIEDPEIRTEFVRDQVRTRLALLIRALRDQPGREWSQAELGRRMGKPQSVVSRIEDPDYGKLSLQTLFEIAEAFDLPLWVDIPEWDEWLRKSKEVHSEHLHRRSFDGPSLIDQAVTAKSGAHGKVTYLRGAGAQISTPQISGKHLTTTMSEPAMPMEKIWTQETQSQ
jgi:transcriptional regulator with XRE-family HTH domain